MTGTWYGQSAASTVYILATVLERVDNDLLWYAACYTASPVDLSSEGTQVSRIGPDLPVQHMSNIARRVREVSFNIQ